MLGCCFSSCDGMLVGMVGMWNGCMCGGSVNVDVFLLMSVVIVCCNCVCDVLMLVFCVWVDLSCVLVCVIVDVLIVLVVSCCLSSVSVFVYVCIVLLSSCFCVLSECSMK